MTPSHFPTAQWLHFRAVCCLALLAVAPVRAGDVEVTHIQAVHRHGQTFITWKDVAEGEAGAKYRYSLYRSDKPITADTLKDAELCYHGVLNNSARLFGTAFNAKDRIDPKKPTAVLIEGGTSLPMWSGLAVHTVRKPGKAYYAVVATDEKLVPLSMVVPGKSATTEPVEEKVAPIEPIKLYDSKSRGIYSPQTSITGKKDCRCEWSCTAARDRAAPPATMATTTCTSPPRRWATATACRACSLSRNGVRSRRTTCSSAAAMRSNTLGAEGRWRRTGSATGASPSTPRIPSREHTRSPSRRQEWITDWVTKTYAPDPERVTASGGSMGAWGSTTYALRHPERFAAVYPNRPRTRQRGLPSLAGQPAKGATVLMDDGKTDYYARMDMVKFAGDHLADLPFYGWCCGRRDGFASWQEQIDMVKAMAAARHGFAFAWNDGDHSTGAQPMAKVIKYYPAELFARNKSYPAFSNSSIDQKLGNGDPKDGDLEGGINLGFKWSDVVDEDAKWSVRLSNELATGDMTVDMTPRRCQHFKPKAGAECKWTTSAGASGTATANANGLVTIPRVRLTPGKNTVLTITR